MNGFFISLTCYINVYPRNSIILLLGKVHGVFYFLFFDDVVDFLSNLVSFWLFSDDGVLLDFTDFGYFNDEGSA